MATTTQQGRLADAGAGKQAQPLTLAAGGEQIERTHAKVDSRSEPGALGRRRGGGANQAADRTWRQSTAAVQRVAKRVDHPAEPGVGDGEAAAMAEHDGLAARAKAVRRRKGQRLRSTTAKVDDLRQDLPPAAGRQGNAVSD